MRKDKQKDIYKLPAIGEGLVQPLARRTFLGGMVAATGAALVGSRTAWSAPAPLEKELVFACNGGLLEKMFRRLGSTFEQKTGTKVTLVVGTSLGNLAKMQVAKNKPEVDVAFNTDVPHMAGKREGLFEKLDQAVVTNLSQIYDILRDPDGIGAGCLVTSIGMGYNPEKFKQAGIVAPTSWKDLWDPRLKGHVAIVAFGVSWAHDFLVLISRMEGGSEKDVRPGIAKIKELKASGNLALMPNTPAELENMLTQGIAWACVSSCNRSYTLKDSGFPFDFVYPKEGASLTGNWIDVVKNAPHPRAAQAFANHMLSEEGQKILAEFYYGPANKTVVLPPEQANKVPYGAERINSLVPLDRDMMNKQLDNWNELWNREIARAG